MIFIDSDILVYRVGFGCNNYEDFVDVADVLETTIKDINQKISVRFPRQETVLVISNTNKTFRHDVAVTVPYKGNRKAEKPIHYHDIRQYLIDELGAVMSPDGYEADDYIGVNTNKKTDVIAGIDKDLDMIPAKAHYNFVRDEMYKVKRPAYYFWHQMCTGDRADNIIGLTGIGEKKASKLLDGMKTKDMRKIVEGEYQREFGENWKDRFTENGRLLWIKRDYEKDFWHYV